MVLNTDAISSTEKKDKKIKVEKNLDDKKEKGEAKKSEREDKRKKEKKESGKKLETSEEVHLKKENSTENGRKKSKASKRKPESDNNDSEGSIKPKKKRRTEDGKSNNRTGQNVDMADANAVTPPPVEKEEEEEDIPENLRFSSYRLTEPTLKALEKRGFKSMFPIQAAAFDHIYDGKDILARAKTGTGKTLAFALPMTESLLKASDFLQNQKSRGRAPRVIVIIPTRDLARQVATEFDTIAPSLTVLCIYGGVPYHEQYQNLRAGIDVLVGTPGRIIDHIDRGNLKLGDLKFICLDEADQMLDIGFGEDMEKVLQHVKEHKERQGKGTDYQTMLFSATVPDWVKETVKNYLRKDYVTIDLVGKMDTKTNENIRHYAIRSAWSSRKDIIGDVVACYGGQGSCVIFCNTKNDANELALNDKLKQDCQVLHGDIAQAQREITMKGFRVGKFKCIICTDVLARGIDIPQVDLVINCEPPKDVETYVHRSGRTGRAGRSGTAVTFFKSQEEYLIQNIQRRTKIQFQIVGPPQPTELIAVAAIDAIQNVESVNNNVLSYFHETANALIEKKGAVEALSAALAYMTGYANGVKSRSLLSGDEGYTTLLFRFSFPVRYVSYVRNILSKGYPELTADDVKIMRLTKDSLGVAVDIASGKVEICTGENDGIFLGGRRWSDTKSTTLEVCKELPDLLDSRGAENLGLRCTNGNGFKNANGVSRNNNYNNGRRNGYNSGRGGGTRSNGYGGGRGSGINFRK